MATCKNCGRGFHACGSCGITTNWEWDYCSDPCHQDAIQKAKSELSAKHGISVEVINDIVEEFQDRSLMEY